MEILVVTGMSGAGKSIVVDALEDLGYFCIDNLPPKLIVTFAQLLDKASERYEKVAIVTDIRASRHCEDILTYLDYLHTSGFTYKIFFIDANDETLIRRYKETRRRHPLLEENDGSLSKSISMERVKLRQILSVADYYLDSSRLTSAECKKRVAEILMHTTQNMLQIHCMSFGFKYGLPADCDLVFDVRCLPNPFYELELKNLTGLDQPVVQYIMQFDEAKTLMNKLDDLIDYLLPMYIKEGKSQLTIAFGCTGGKHRSVCFAQHMCEHLSQYNTTIHHRDITK